MKKALFCLSLLFVFIFVSCGNEETSIKQVISEYQNALNSNDSNRIRNCFEDKNAFGLDLAISLINGFREQGIVTEYRIDVLEVKVNDNIAEAKLKTSVSYSGDDKDAIAGLSFLTPPISNSVMTLRKTNNEWKIISEDISDL